ncbi:MAG TPA: DNA repair protein RecO [Ruminococcaceae bacterium]|nr:DNA repair protein RecO [Oscillospiraceae bacterium]
MQTKTKGIVIREQTVGESDKLITLLTADYGLVKAFVRRAKNIKSQKLSSTSLFAYSEFSLYRSNEAYVVDSASPIEVFFDLRGDIQTLSLAQYFAQATYFCSSQEQPAPETLRLLLNSLHLLCKGEKSHLLIKSAFEFRLMTLSGYMPDILACYRCGEYESDIMYFDVQEGCIYCKDCYRNNAIEVPLAVIKAIRYICLVDLGKVFSFNISESNMKLLSQCSEKYLLSRIDTKLSTLEFYKAVM